MNDIQEMVKVMLNFEQGKAIEFTMRNPEEASSYDWMPCPTPEWNWGTRIYRVALEMPEVDWSDFPEDYKWLAIDENEAAFVYKNRPFLYPDAGMWFDPAARRICAEDYWEYSRGTVDWRESLVKRKEFIDD